MKQLVRKSFVSGFARRILLLFCMALILICIFSACDKEGKVTKINNPDNNNTPEQTIEEAPAEIIEEPADDIDTLEQKEIKKVNISTNYNNIALFLSGYKQKGRNELTPYQDSATWKKYSRSSDGKWNRLQRVKLSPIAKFRDVELAEVNRNTKVLFYPFGGPDFLHAYQFFPYAETFILIGLERLGSLPGVENMEGDSAMIKYFAMVNRSLSTILAISFFRTVDMKADFKSEELDGILPVFLIFCARTGNQITDINPITINDNGDAVPKGGSNFSRAWAVEISLVDKHGDNKKLYYFSKNLSDNSFNPNNAFYKFIKKQGSFTTYLKAASYLMHNKETFANIRNVVLSQSNYLIQDDSGIPVSYFPEKDWKLTFYGSYTKPINMFKTRLQEDLSLIYKDSSRINPLPFGIGYQHTKGTSNLMLAKRIKKK